jgi:thymidylate synthase
LRFFTSFSDALNEMRRDVAELGTKVHPQTMQDKQIADDPDYETMEYRNAIFTVTRPSLGDLNPSQPWADAEFDERVRGVRPEDGEAWKLRPDVWTEFESRGFGYSYGERYSISLSQLINELEIHPDSRQLFLSVWNPEIDADRLGVVRVPCSLGYWFSLRARALHVTYLQRSADIVTHFENDVYLAHKLQEYIALNIGADIGQYSHWIGSLHAYRKDIAEIF